MGIESIKRVRNAMSLLDITQERSIDREEKESEDGWAALDVDFRGGGAGAETEGAVSEEEDESREAR